MKSPHTSFYGNTKESSCSSKFGAGADCAAMRYIGLLILTAYDDDPYVMAGWCAICPIPLPGEWLQNGALLKPQGKGFGLKRKWPKRFRNIWLQNVAFTLLALFSAAVLTQPSITGAVLLLFLIVVLVVSLIFERRALCRYVCPVGGFIGLYSQVAPVEVRVKDPAICVAHKEKSCYIGSADGYGWPWLVHPGTLTKNINCGLCVECLRTCTQNNVAFNLRSFGADLQPAASCKLDETFKVFIMLGAALTYSAVMLGPWGALKTAAYSIGTAQWFVSALTLLGLIYVILPGAFLIAVLLGRALAKSREPSLKKTPMPGMQMTRQANVTGHETVAPIDFTDSKNMLGACNTLLEGKLIHGGMGTGMPHWGPIFSCDGWTGSASG
ncbi:MAG TPA: 4Fe-4S binding protein [Anaerolineae bacterium]|nr:4Fe-4S binding protein [Anaerolineae bacterium]